MNNLKVFNTKNFEYYNCYFKNNNNKRIKRKALKGRIQPSLNFKHIEFSHQSNSNIYKQKSTN